MTATPPTKPSNETIFAVDLADPRARQAAQRGPLKAAPHRDAGSTSDVSRASRIGMAAVFAGGSAIAAFVILPGAWETKASGPGPLSYAHAQASLKCTQCHGDADPGTEKHVSNAKSACTTCHEAHPSTREGHRKLAKAGELGCTTCHMPHGPHQGALLAADGTAARYGQGGSVGVNGVSFRAGRRILVPLIPAKACLGCHDDSPKDPLAHCLSDHDGVGGHAVSLCFDEHQEALPRDATDVAGPRSTPTALSTKSVCAGQHFPDRPDAWEAARVAVAKVPWVSAPEVAGGSAALAGLGALGGALGYAGTGVVGWLRRRKRKVEPPQVKAAPRKRLPVIDTNTCLGCYACVDACPYGVLEVEKYVAVVARPDACCGLVLCEQRCPNGSLKMTDGEVIADRPRIDDTLQSPDVPGLYLAGDITGLPLIKNAILQGDRAAGHALDHAAKNSRDGVFDLCIVGAGPSGISAALRAKEKGASFVVFEQGNVAESIRSFPRGKLIFDQPLEIPIAGKLWLKESTKEELLLHWMRIVRREELPIREGRRMTGVTRLPDGTFEVRAATTDGNVEEVVRSAAVIMAIGRRGTPRKLSCEVPQDAESRVYYHLADARSLRDQAVVVVGIGDTAMEAAIAIASQDPGTPSARPLVTIVARAATYSRGQPRNIHEVERLRKTGRISILWKREIASVRMGTEGRILLGCRSADASEAPSEIEADVTLVLIGSIPPNETLSKAGVRKVEVNQQ